jgi:hypothetical protein
LSAESDALAAKALILYTIVGSCTNDTTLRFGGDFFDFDTA